MVLKAITEKVMYVSTGVKVIINANNIRLPGGIKFETVHTHSKLNRLLIVMIRSFMEDFW